MAFDCEHCGATGFANQRSLGSHKNRNSRCKRLQREAVQKTSTVNPIPPAACVEGAILDDDEMQNVGTQDESDDGGTSDSTSSFGGDTSNSDILMGQAKTFDSSLHLAHFIRHCRKTMGLSHKDTSSLLTTLFHPSFRLDEVRFRTLQEFKAYEEELINTTKAEADSDGCEWQEVLVCPGDSDLKLRYKDSVSVLRKLFSARKNKREFVLKAEEVENGEYSTAQTGLWWREMEKHVGCEGAVIAPIILYSDATSLSNDQRTSGYPLVMSLGNIPCSARSLDHGHALLGILPIVGTNDPVVINASNARVKKLEIFQQCLKLILQPLKDASFEGLHLKDPHGCSQWVYPMLYSYIADHPEGCKISCTFDTNKCAFPCSVCLCPRDLLGRVDLSHEWRTEASMISLQNQLAEMTHDGQVAAASRLSLENSVHPLSVHY